MSAYVVPIMRKEPTETFDIFVILTERGWERLRKHDPVELETSKMGFFAKLRLEKVHICYEDGADLERALNLLRTDVLAGIGLLRRGWMGQPEDYDGDYRSIL